MENTHHDTTAHTEDHDFSTKAIWRTFWVLLAITVVELVLAIIFYEKPGFMPKHFLNGLFIIGTLAKAFFIVAEFMHLRHELKNMIMTIVVPLALFIWFITAFLYDGNSFKNLRNTYDGHFKESANFKAPAKHHEGGAEHKEAKHEEAKEHGEEKK
jgi:cytochrome c oxidase subunit IV